MKRYVIAANWKMNRDLSNGEELARAIRLRAEEKNLTSKVEIVLCPPFILLDRIAAQLRGSSVALGAQNMYYEKDGPYTGEISGSMLVSTGCNHVILGHSERRSMFAENDPFINRKVQSALNVGLTPIICVGETLDERERGVTFAVVRKQVEGVLSGLDMHQARSVIIAYEPVWAIGTGINATPEQAQEVHAFIRGLVGELYSATVADNIVIQYGGSMKAENARELLGQPDVNGGLVGGASLAEHQFIAIVEAAFSLV